MRGVTPGVRYRQAARSTARAKMASSIGSVSRPVNVFCWLGWNEHSSGRAQPRPSATSTPWPNRGRRPHPEVAARRLVAERAEAHDHAHVRQQRPTRASRNGAHASRSAGVGWLSGGAHLTAAVTHASVSASPSSSDDRRRLVRQAGPVHRPEQPVAAAVAGEHPTGAVARRARPAPGRARRSAPPGRRSRGSAGPSTSRRGTPPACRARPARATRRAAGRRGSRRRRLRAAASATHGTRQ